MSMWKGDWSDKFEFDGQYEVDLHAGRITSFNIQKRITYRKLSLAQRTAERLDKLKTEDFGNQIKIPYFEYQQSGNEVIILMEYIKGQPVPARRMHILRNAFLEREDPYTIIDLSPYNFVWHWKTECAWVIDLDSYRPVPDRRKRVLHWNMKMAQAGVYDKRYNNLIMDEQPTLNWKEIQDLEIKEMIKNEGKQKTSLTTI